MAKVAALLYHDVTNDPRASGFGRASAQSYKHSPEIFETHLSRIASSPLRPSLVTDSRLDRSARYLLLTFDDGGMSAVAIGDMLSAREWVGHFFITTSRIGDKSFVKSSDILYLQSCGHLIGSHSHTHPDIFRHQPPAKMVDEWRVSREILEDILQSTCEVGSVPGGDVSKHVYLSADQAGLRYLFTSRPSLKPRMIGRTWIIGRACPKASVPPIKVERLATFRGWAGQAVSYGLKTGLKRSLPPLYRAYVRKAVTESER